MSRLFSLFFVSLLSLSVSGCDLVGKPKAIPLCGVGNQSDCKDIEILRIKSQMYTEALQKFNECNWYKCPFDKTICGVKPEWKDFK